MSRSTINDALSEWVSGVTKRKTIFDNVARMGPRSSKIGCSMVLGITHSGFGDVELEDLPGDPPIPEPTMLETSRVQGTLFVSMNLLKGDTLLDMAKLRASVNLTSNSELFKKAGLGFARVGDIRDLSEIVQNEPEPRHQADWEFNIQTELTDEIFSIESVLITGNGTPVLVEI